MSNTDHISFNTLVHPDAQADFESVAPTRREVKKNLAQHEEERRCNKCGKLGPESGLKVCGGCKLNRYCSKECQVSDWPEHKKPCKAHRETDVYEAERRHPDLAIKLAQRLPSNDYLMHLFQLYALLALDLLAAPANALTSMLKVTVSTLPADTMGALKAMMDQRDTSKFEVMLHIAEVQGVPQELTPAMQRELDDVRAKPGVKATAIVPLFFTNGTNAFFHPVRLLPAAIKDARDRPPFQIKSSLLGGITELPLNESNLRDTMNSFIRMDKKNQMKLHATPK